MRNYAYTYYDKDAHIKQGYIQAYTVIDAKKLLSRQDINIINIEEYYPDKKDKKIEEIKKESSFSLFLKRMKFQKKLNYDEFIIFMKEFTALIKSGIGIMNSLEILAGQIKNKTFHDALLQISEDIYNGFSMYTAFDKQDIFPKLFVNLLRAGELSGDLPKILTDLSEYYEKERELRKRALAAVTYPVVVLIVSLLGMIFMVTYIFPSFVNMYKNFNTELPLPTKILIFTVDTAKNPVTVFTFAVCLIVIILFVKSFLNTTAGRYYFDRFILYIPVINNITKKITIARFARTLGTVYEDGMSLHSSLEAAAEIVENAYYKQEFKNIIKRIEDEGVQLSTAISEKYFLFPKIFVNLIAAGEESGDLGFMLKKISGYFEEEIFYIFDNLLNILEPFIVIILGSMVLFIMLSLFLPLYLLVTQFTPG